MKITAQCLLYAVLITISCPLFCPPKPPPGVFIPPKKRAHDANAPERAALLPQQPPAQQIILPPQLTLQQHNALWNTKQGDNFVYRHEHYTAVQIIRELTMGLNPAWQTISDETNPILANGEFGSRTLIGKANYSIIGIVVARASVKGVPFALNGVQPSYRCHRELTREELNRVYPQAAAHTPLAAPVSRSRWSWQKLFCCFGKK